MSASFVTSNFTLAVRQPSGTRSRRRVSVVEDVRREHELDRALPDVVADRGGVPMLKMRKSSWFGSFVGLRRPSSGPSMRIAAKPARASSCAGPVPGHRACRSRLHAAIDERAIAARARAREDDRRETARRHRGPRDRDDDARRLVALEDRLALRVEHPVAAVLVEYGGVPAGRSGMSIVEEYTQ